MSGELHRISYRERVWQPRKTEGHLFRDHLISVVLRHQLLQKLLAIMLSSVSLWLV
jgi:hypothetical protein